MQRVEYDQKKLGFASWSPKQGGRLNRSLINYHGGIPEYDEYLKTVKKNEITPEFAVVIYDEIVIFVLYRGENPFGGFAIHKESIIEIKSTHAQNLNIRKDSKIKGGALEFISGTMGIVGGIVAVTVDALTTGKGKEQTVLGSVFEIVIKTEQAEPETIVLSCTDKNKEIIEGHLKLLTIVRKTKNETIEEKKKACYIATVCYGDIDSPEVSKLRQYRDEKLNKNFIGRLFVRFYYLISPTIADYLKGKSKINKVIKTYILDKIYTRIK